MIYYISNEYLEYLRKFDKRIYENKGDEKNKIRKYLGIVLKIGIYDYYIPLSSPKDTDYLDEKRTKVRKSIIPIIRITQNNNPNRLYGTLRVSNMIPVPITEIQQYKIEEEKDINYKNLILAEIRYIKKNENMIRKNAQILYRQKEKKMEISYVKNTLEFKLLEEKCKEYKKTK